ncbi:class I SAM-dependent methyltransferase [Pseudoalteromonas sp. BZB3]|uniref:class I SAM-dependent methyltransferase n=1 Tax=Pseudoalteromonas sp. BZB3 TaxID=3136670 RepID=UPI0032C3E71E|tara:strand:- start:2353 stop:3024 length:672 start_codon:yes stop_codon:yes gene_type:complete
MSDIEKKRQAWHEQAQGDNAQKQVARLAENNIWTLLVENINLNLELSGDETLLDVGCGNAYLLSRLKVTPKNIYGMDFAENMISEAKKRLPEGTFLQSEANEVPFKGPFQRVLSYSIFHYFPDLEYAKQVLIKLIAITDSKGQILIGDLLDSRFEEEIKSGSDLTIEASLPVIHRYSQWLFIDISSLKKWLEQQPRVAYVDVINQPSEFSLSWYRKDLKITLK